MVKYWERFLLGGILILSGILICTIAAIALLTAEEQAEPGFIIPFNIIFLLLGICALMIGLVSLIEGLIKERRNKNKEKL